MHDEAAFLAQIRTTPDDVAPRLVYADWLEEHDDPRGELIRLTEEMRTLAPYSDAYWTRKPRRRELLRGVPDQWLAALSYRDVQPVLAHGVPDDWKGRWRLLRERFERWTGHRMGDVGGQTVAIATVEDRLGRTLPPSLRELVAMQYDFLAINQNTEKARPESLLEWIPSSNAVRLIYREFPFPELYLRIADWDEDDPPVYPFDRMPLLDPTARSRDLSFSGECLWATIWHDFWYYNSAWSMNADSLPNVATVRQQLNAAFIASATLGHRTYYESPNITARFEEDAQTGTGRIMAFATRQATSAQVPEFLRAYINPKRAGGVFREAAKSQRK